MAITTSELTLKINSTGIDKAAADLKELAKAAASVDAETKSFVISQAKLQAANEKSSKTTVATARGITTQELAIIKAHEAALKMNASIDAQAAKQEKLAQVAERQVESQKRLAESYQTTARGVSQQELAMIKAHEAANKMNSAFDAKKKKLEELSNRGNVYVNTLRSMATAALAYVGINFFTNLFKQADAWSMMQSKLNLAVGSMSAAKNAQDGLFEMSQRLRVPLEEVVKLYTRMYTPLQRIGATSKDAMTVVGAFSTALKLAGATGQEASSAMLQFSQSLNAGRLNGGEFNSVAEAAPNVLRAIETELIKTGRGAELAKGGLKKMATEGKLTTEVLVNALKNAAPKWRAEFESLPITVDGALTRIKNAWEKAIGEVGQDTKFNERMASALKSLEGSLPSLARTLGTLLSIVAENLDAIIFGVKSLVAIGMLKWIADAVMSFIELNKVLGITKALFATIGITPLGLALTALGGLLIGGSLLWSKYAKSIDEANAEAKKKADEVPNLVRAWNEENNAIERQIDLLREQRGEKALFRGNKKDSAVEIRVEDLSKYKQALAKVNQARDDLSTAKKAWDDSDKGSLNSAGLFRDFKNKELIYKSSVAVLKDANAQRLREQELSGKLESEVVLKNRNTYVANALGKYSSQNEVAAKKQKEALAELDKFYKDESSRDSNYYKIKAGIIREYNESLEKGKPTKEKDLFDGQVELYKEIMELRAKSANKEVEETKKRVEGMYDQNESMKSQLEILNRQLETEESLTRSKAEQNVLEAERALSLLNASGVMGVEIALANERVRLAKELAAVTGKIDTQKDLQKSKDFLDKMFDDAKVDSWTNSVSKGLSGIVKSFTDLSKAMDKFSSKQALIKKGREEYANIAKSGTESEIELSNRKARLDEKEAEYKIASYAEMADAAKGFFAEGTRGYQTLDGVSKIFHAAQMARNLIEMGQLAIKAVMNQANGDPYTAWARMGAMAAVVAGLGFAVGGGFSGGKGGEKAEDVQKTQGTGTVLGDSSAKSDSLTKALDSLKKNFDKLYPVNVGMLNALKNIEKSMTGLTNIVFRTGITTDTMGIQQGTISQGSKLTNSLSNIPMPVTAILGGWIGLLGSKIAGLIGNLWGKTTQNIVDSGLSLGGSLAGLKQGQGINQYASVDVTKSSWFGLKKTTTNQVQQQAVSNDISSQIGMIFSGMQTALEEAGKALFGKSDDVTKALEALTLSTTKISLKGLTGQALSDALNAVISKGLDEMAGSAFKDFAKYQQVGEGMAATVLRVADNFATVNSIMSKMNLTLFEMSMSGIDASLKLSELMGGLEELKSAASSYYENFFTEEERNAKTLEALKEQFKGMNQELPTSIKGYRELLESLSKAGDTEKVATMLKLSDAFAALYKSSSDSLDPLTAAKDAFDKLSKDAERWLNIRNQATALKDSLDAAMGNSKKDPALRIKKLWDAMSSDISPEQKLTLANELKDLILDKYQVEKEGIQKLIDFGKQLRGYTDSLKIGALSPLTTTQKLAEAQKQFQETLNKAMGGDTAAQSALTGKADAYLQLAQTAYASSGAYTSIFENVTGALDALGLSSMSAEDKTAQLQQSQYDELAKLRDYAAKMETLSDSYYKTNLSLLADQTTALSKLYDKMGVFDGIAANLGSLPAEIAANLSEIMKGNSSGNFITSLYNSVAGKSGDMIDKQGFDYWTNELNLYGKEWVTRSFQESVKVVTGGGIAALPRTDNTEVVAQLAAVKEELTAMRVEAQKQTGDLIVATYDANSANAAAVVEGTSESLQQNAWAVNTTPTLI